MENLGAYFVIFVIYFLPMIYLLSEVIFDITVDEMETDRHVSLMFISAVPALNTLVALIFIASRNDSFVTLQKQINKVYTCNECELDFYQGYGILHERFKEEDIKCPFCDSLEISTSDKKQASILKRFNLIRTIKFGVMHRKFENATKRDELNKDKKDQMEKYLKLKNRGE